MTAEEIIKELRRRAAEQFREAERADPPHKQYYAGSAWAYADAEALLREHLCPEEQPNEPDVTLCHRCHYQRRHHAMTETIGAGGSGAYPTKEHAMQAAADQTAADSISDLIARIEATAESSLALDEKIARAAGWKRHDGAWHLPGSYFTARSDSAPKFTSSIDRAMLLVPEGWNIISMDQVLSDGFWGVDIASIEAKSAIYSQHKILPIAICIAALKARFV